VADARETLYQGVADACKRDSDPEWMMQERPITREWLERSVAREFVLVADARETLYQGG
jgi:hypothetical protein